VRGRARGFRRSAILVTIGVASPADGTHQQHSRVKEDFSVADTKKIEDTQERKKVKRAARKKAAPKAKRTTPRGSNKKKVKKLARGQSKR
jgi:hypothetical protein